MAARLLADFVVAIHLAFIVFVIAGGLLTFKRPRWSLAHLPAVAWAAWTEFTGTLCPLTPLENTLRRAAGEAGYDGGFVEHYIVPLIYPAALTPRIQLLLGLVVVALNALIYALSWRSWRSRQRAAGRRDSCMTPSG